ncbi:MAG: thioredoxin family protein [Candidatus Calescibacterium sp.]|nr:thioredoxin family protein [Candidatus Calescibacterium sp.]MCX7972308.1 thioredoxin family protein [bacterium]MDW8195088.1 thioredoxin family protein [Candidatus Calescibacterium sp.]
MAVESIKIPLGTEAPYFELKDPYGKVYKLDELFGSKGLVIIFTCNHCPYAQAIWPRSIELYQKVKDKGINFVAINPNVANPAYPEDSIEKMKEYIQKLNIPFPYLIDETQEVARKYNAQCTPDIYLYNAERKLVYHGRFDDNWKDPNKVKSKDLEEAILNLIEGREINPEQYPSIGCSIKWVK